MWKARLVTISMLVSACATEAVDTDTAQLAANELAVALGDTTASSELTFDCLAGGSIGVSQQASAKAEPASAELGLAVIVDKCDAGLGSVTGGRIEVSKSIDAVSGRLALELHGALSFTGKLELACEVDVSAAFSKEGGPKLEGTFCGVPVALLDLAFISALPVTSP